MARPKRGPTGADHLPHHIEEQVRRLVDLYYEHLEAAGRAENMKDASIAEGI